jgi:hypothetical protein
MNKSSILKSNLRIYVFISVVICLLTVIFGGLFLNLNKPKTEKNIDLEQVKWLAFDKEAQRIADSIATKNLEFHAQLVDPKNALKTTTLTVNPIGIDPTTGKEIRTGLASKVKKIELSFALGNTKAKKGEHEIYLRVLDSKNQLLGSQGKSFFVIDDHLQYTAKAIVHFSGNQEIFSMTWENPNQFSKGTYDVWLYADGYLMMRKLITLK